MEKCGVKEYSFYYPYPDYKFPTTVFSDKKLPKVGELYQNIRNFDRDRVMLFDEQKAFDMIIRDGAFSQYSNSYMVIIGPELDTVYSKYSNDRAPEFSVRTDILKSGAEFSVKKTACTTAAVAHVTNMASKAEALTKAYAGTGLSINQCKLNDGAEFEYLEGITLEEILDECIKKNKKGEFLSLISRYRKIIEQGALAEVSDYDLIFQNIMVKDDDWTVIDYEWTFDKTIPAKLLWNRALYCYFADRKNRDAAKDWLKEAYPEEKLFEAENEAQVLTAERAFQKYVQGDYMAASEIRHAIGNPVYSLDYLLDAVGARGNGIQIYEDTGKGFSEEQSYRIQNIARIGDNYDFDIKLNPDLINVRIDPCDRPCIVSVESVQMDGEELVSKLAGKGQNGFRAHNGVRLANNSFFFADGDPHFMWKVDKYAKKEAAVLHVKLRMEYLSPEMAGHLLAGFGMKAKLGSGR